MATYTTNLNLKKPALTDVADIADINGNMDILDGLTQDNIPDGTTYKRYSSTEKTKLSGIAEGAEVNVNADWNASSGDAEILNKPTIPTVPSFTATATDIKMNGTQAVGSEATVPRADHVHPSDTSRSPLRPTTTSPTDSFTLALSDANTRILATKTTAMTITIPLESAVAFTVGDTIEVVQYGEGAVTIAITATGTLLSKDSKVITGGRYSAVSMTKLATNTWLLIGSLV